MSADKLKMQEIEELKNATTFHKKRANIKIQKIENDKRVYEDEELDDEENWEDLYEDEEDNYQDGVRIAPSSSENSDSEAEEKFIPRCKLKAYQEIGGKVMKQKLKNPNKFTKGTDPAAVDKMQFLLDEAIACPQFLPLVEEDVQLNDAVIRAAIEASDIPLSEFMKKQRFYSSISGFCEAVKADSALVKTEI